MTSLKEMEPPLRLRGRALRGSCEANERGSQSRRTPAGRERETDLDGSVLKLEVEENLHVDETLPEFSVDGSEEVERQRELEDELVDHDKIADRHGAWKKRIRLCQSLDSEEEEITVCAHL